MKSNRLRMIALAAAAMSLTVNNSAYAASFDVQDPSKPKVAVVEKAPPSDPRLREPVKETLDQRYSLKPQKNPDKPEPVFWVILGIGVAAILGGMLLGPNPNKCGPGELPPACDR